MSHSKSKELDRLLDKLREMKFRIESNGKKNRKTIKLIPPGKNDSMYIIHYDENAYHPVRKYLKNKLDIIL